MSHLLIAREHGTGLSRAHVDGIRELLGSQQRAPLHTEADAPLIARGCVAPA
jgi:hypothetical protein